LNIAEPEDEEETGIKKEEQPRPSLIFPKDSKGYAILPPEVNLSRKAQMSMIRDYCTINYRKLFLVLRSLYNAI
jgi:hypothetical protein